MGFFGKLFGGGKVEYPPLDPASAGAQTIEKFRSRLEALVQKINDRYEVVPAQSALYVFIGKPPGMFGVAWFLEGDADEHNLKKLISKKGLSQKKIDALMQKMRTAYTEAENEPRYALAVGGKDLVVTSSERLAGNLHAILHVMDE